MGKPFFKTLGTDLLTNGFSCQNLSFIQATSNVFVACTKQHKSAHTDLSDMIKTDQLILKKVVNSLWLIIFLSLFDPLMQSCPSMTLSVCFVWQSNLVKDILSECVEWKSQLTNHNQV